MSFGYPKSARLRRREEFNYVFSRGKKARGKYVKVLYVTSPDGETRIGVAVGKKQAKSWARNRGRRMLKEAARRLLPWLKEGYWIVFLLSTSGLAKGAREIYFDMASLCKQEGLMRIEWPGIDFTPWENKDEKNG